MHVAAERAEAVVIVCLPCAHNDAVAAANVVRFDPASRGVGLERTQPISLDVGLTDLTAHFSGVEEVRGRVLCGCRFAVWRRHARGKDSAIPTIVNNRIQPNPTNQNPTESTRPRQMAANIGSIGACGFLIRARQSCLPPQYAPSRFRVGGWHAADVPIVVKGTRPPMKVGGDVFLTRFGWGVFHFATR